MADTIFLLTVALTFLLAGLVKGVTGLGLPTLSLAVLTAVMGLQSAMALILVPSFMTNVWQAATGRNFSTILRRLWPFLLTATAGIWLGAQALTWAHASFLPALLGVLLVAYAVTGLRGLKIVIDRAWEGWTGPLFGTVNGVLTGLTGSFVFPGVLYLQAIGLPKDSLVQAMGMLFTSSTVGLALALGGQQLLTTRLGLLSLGAVLPAVIGMMLGQQLRRRIPESSFRRVFLVSLLLLGLYIMAMSVQ
ncbi:membrane protein [Deinococcus malanensis]|uniref:Probable membrane transporter protein n=1 Tax=Deinococcus malanensis TaxID=1706855 RepID=A0ABQ2F2S1_9DEIO|nr:sulfite exporter TauE/SafE family protein [Deinococcus malanensis]GGK43683.1 membrane protein [Deinococcus malanensis]